MKTKLTYLGLFAALIANTNAMAGVIYSEDFESGAPGFSFSSFWHVTQNVPYAGSNALGFVHDETPGSTPDGSYAGTDGSEQFAFGPAISLPNASSISLSFAALVADELGDTPDGFDRLSVGISLDGSTFNTVLASSNPQNGGVNIPENVGYNLLNIDMSAFADQNVYLAFSFATFDDIYNAHPGPRIDNIQIASNVPEPATFTLMGLGIVGMSWMSRRKAA